MAAHIDLYQQLGLSRSMPTAEIARVLEKYFRQRLYEGNDEETLRSLDASRLILGNDHRRRLYDMRLDGQDSGSLDEQALYDLANMDVPADSQNTQRTAETTSSAESVKAVQTPQGSQPSQNADFTFVGQAETNSFDEVSEASSVSVKDQEHTASQYDTEQGYPVGQQDNQSPIDWFQPRYSLPQVAAPPAAVEAQSSWHYAGNNYGEESHASASGAPAAFYRSPIVPVIMGLYLLASIVVRVLTVVEWTQGDDSKAFRSLGLIATMSSAGKVAFAVPSLLALVVSVLLIVIGVVVYMMRCYILGFSLWVAVVVIDFVVGLVQAIKAMNWTSGTVTDLGFGPYVLMGVALMGFVLAISSVLSSRR